MHKINLPIDTKSLYYNINNDNLKGHTCTVATPIKQGKSLNQYLNEIYKIPQQIDYEQHEKLVDELRKNSKSIVRINNVFVFDKIKVNNHLIDCEASYCIYVKEEIDETKVQFGRIKMHYPLSLKYESLNIDNKKVLNKISEYLNDYAFLIESFDYDFDDDSLNFNALVVGYNQIPYSKIFINNKGVGSKFNQDLKYLSDCYDYEIISLKKQYGNDVGTESFEEYMEKAREESFSIVNQYLISEGAYEIRFTSNEYPYCIYDVQYYLNGNIYYGVIRSTYTKQIYADLSAETNRFINLFNNTNLFIVTEVIVNNVLKVFNNKQLEQFKTKINSIRLIK